MSCEILVIKCLRYMIILISITIVDVWLYAMYIFLLYQNTLNRTDQIFVSWNSINKNKIFANEGLSEKACLI